MEEKNRRIAENKHRPEYAEADQWRYVKNNWSAVKCWSGLNVNHSVKIRCDIIAINLNLLASEPDNMTLRRVTLKHVASLAEALCVTDLDQLQRRRAPRTNFGNWTVRIEVDGREPVFAYVWDVSPTGACLLVAEDVDLPAVFTIHFDNIPRQAQVVWRRWSFLGARFTDQLGAQIREQYELTLKRAADRHGGLPSYARARIP